MKIEMEQFEIDFLQLKARFNMLVKQQHIEGYVYSFFDYYDEKTKEYNNLLKKEITVLNGSYISFSSQRDSSLYDVKNDVITLHPKEVLLINNSYFIDKTISLYQGLLLDLETFYHANYLYNQFSIIDKLKYFRDYMNGNFSSYSDGKISNLDLLNIANFKDHIQRENIKITSSIDQKLEYLIKLTERVPNSSEPAWEKVAAIFANGDIRVISEKRSSPRFFFKDIEFTNINKMSHYIENTLSLKKDSLRPYISDTIGENSNKNIFEPRNFKVLQRIKFDLLADNKEVSSYYELRLQQLSEQCY
jgi:hypothetical protein